MCCPSNTRKHPEPPCPPQGLLLSLEQSCSSHHPWPWPKGKQALMTVLTMRRVWCWTGVVCGPNIFNRPLILRFLFVCLPCFWHGRKQCHTFSFLLFSFFCYITHFLEHLAPAVSTHGFLFVWFCFGQGMWVVRSSGLTREQTCTPCIGSTES